MICYASPTTMGGRHMALKVRPLIAAEANALKVVLQSEPVVHAPVPEKEALAVG